MTRVPLPLQGSMAALGVAAFAVSVAPIHAQIPSKDGVIHACVHVDRDNDEAKLTRLVELEL